MNSIKIEPILFEDLSTFFTSFNLKNDEPHIQKYFGFIQEASFCYQNIIHKIYNKNTDTIIGFVALSTTKEVDDISGILIEFLYLLPQYRGKVEPNSTTKYSYLLLDYIIALGIDIQKQIAINHIYLVPISDEIRALYSVYGFENIPASGNNEFEDYMVFNLLDNDPTIL